jgi:import receptor subunit TOM20
MSYVRATPTEGETPGDNRKMRRQELARGWRFACECTKCTEEAAETEKDKAHVSESVEHGEAKDKVEKVAEERQAAST